MDKSPDGPVSEFGQLLEKIDTPYMRMAIRDRVEDAANSYLKKLAGLAGCAFLLAGWLGYKQIADLDSTVKEQKKEVTAQLDALKKEVNDASAKLSESAGKSLSEINAAAGRVKDSEAGLKDTIQQMTFESKGLRLEAEQAKADARSASSQVAVSTAQAGQAVADAQRLNAELAKMLPPATMVQRLSQDSETVARRNKDALLQIDELSSKLRDQLKQTETLRAELNQAKGVLREIQLARTIQIVMLRSKDQTRRTVVLPPVTEGRSPVTLSLSIPSGLDRSWLDLTASADGYSVAPLKKLSIGDRRDLGDTGYQVELEFIYHDWKANDFAVLKIQPRAGR